jgi:FtsP/CotA-like multicopper oxidase with cupredoxin domain
MLEQKQSFSTVAHSVQGGFFLRESHWTALASSYSNSAFAIVDRVAMRRLSNACGVDKIFSSARAFLPVLSLFFIAVGLQALHAQASDPCPRPQPGAVVGEPADLASKSGALEVTLAARNVKEADGRTRYCFTDDKGHESPNLRVHPGDLVVIHLRNAMADVGTAGPEPMHIHDMQGACTSGTVLDLISTNLHFHGMTIPPTCHQDDVLKTVVEPGDPVFTYRFRVPEDEPPGLYWYHPHIHGFAKQQVLGGASGALIVEGIERAKPELAGMPERVFIIRDEDLKNPNARPSKFEPVVPKFMVDRDGDAANNGTGFGKPAKDLSINYVPVPYPDYPPATIRMRPGERQLWRVLNASAITYLNLAVLFNGVAQPLGLVAMDGVPIGARGEENAPPQDPVNWQTHLAVPPGARVEFVVSGPPAGGTGLLVTRMVDTGPGGENDPNRALARIGAAADASEPRVHLESSPQPLPPPSRAWLGDVAPVRVRHLYFSEKLADPNDPTSAIEFYLTVEGQTPKMFDMNATQPNIVAQQGTVEDWIIENRSQELHAFHIHQLHFLLLDYNGIPVHENFLRDTVNVPYATGRQLAYPSVRLRMDFRDPNIVGTFPYHCHLLEHEDKGMMGTIEVLPAESSRSLRTALLSTRAPCASPECKKLSGK